MNGGLLGAGALTVLIAIVHSVLGERYILIRLFRRELPHLFGSDWFTKQTLRFVWHLLSVAWLGFGGLLLVLAQDGAQGGTADRNRILGVIAGTFLATAVVGALASRGRHLSWIVFLAIAGLGWFARG